MCSPLHCTTFSRRRRHSLIFIQGTLVTVVATLRLLHFLVLAQTWNFCSGKPSSEDWITPKQYIVHRIQIWVVWWSQCHVRLDEWHYHVNYCFWWCETARHDLVAASSCNICILPESSNPWPKSFSSLTSTVDLGPWFHKHNACLSCARPT